MKPKDTTGFQWLETKMVTGTAWAKAQKLESTWPVCKRKEVNLEIHLRGRLEKVLSVRLRSLSSGPWAGFVRNRRNTYVHLKYRKTWEWPFALGDKIEKAPSPYSLPGLWLAGGINCMSDSLGKVACWRTVALVNSWACSYDGWEVLGSKYLSSPQYVSRNTWPMGGTMERTLVYRHGILNLGSL